MLLEYLFELQKSLENFEKKTNFLVYYIRKKKWIIYGIDSSL